jgi:hypothetical protein
MRRTCGRSVLSDAVGEMLLELGATGVKSDRRCAPATDVAAAGLVDLRQLRVGTEARISPFALRRSYVHAGGVTTSDRALGPA